ncbi:MAG TPA: peptidylprolyl isomerase [Pseudomonadales bacterium]|nr:peptidylprolyl isomerase [Pseudomonadales bacterium]
MRKKILLLSALLITSSWFSSTYAAESQTLDRVVAVVDDDVIMNSELTLQMNMIANQIQRAGRELPPQEILQKQVLERLIVESLQLQMGQRASVKISDEQLQSTLDSVAAQNHLSTDQFMNELEKNGIPPSMFRENIRRQIIIQQVQQALVNKRIEISDQDVDNFLHSEEGKLRAQPQYHLAHLVLPLNENATAAETAAQEKKAQDIYEQAKKGADFRQLVMRWSGAQDALEGGDLGWRQPIQLPPLYADQVSKMEPGQVSPPLRAENAIHIVKVMERKAPFSDLITQTQARHILVKTSAVRNDDEAKALLQNIRAAVLKGGDFAALAKKYSEDPGSAMKGGDLGWTTPGQMVPEFDQMMNNTAKGDISAPFHTQFGWHILQVQDRRQQDMSAEMMRVQVKNLLRKRQYDDELPRWLKELRDKAYVQVKL